MTQSPHPPETPPSLAEHIMAVGKFIQALGVLFFWLALSIPAVLIFGGILWATVSAMLN